MLTMTKQQNEHETEDGRSLCPNIYCFVNLKVLSFFLNF